jgi:glycine/D-amino acid oxidase-like deaminating enzyme
MRLRTFESFWLLKNGLLYSYPSLQSSLTTEIAVIGAGITGALVSHALMEAGYKVILIDKRDVGQGSTSATTSMLQYEIDVPLYQLADMIGEQNAALCYQSGIDAIRELEQTIAKEKIDCGFQMKKSLFIAHNKKAVKWLRQEFDIRNKYQLGVQWLSDKEVIEQYGIHCFGAILSNTAASVDAYRLAHELILLNVKRGMRVYDQTDIAAFDFESEQPVIHTRDGYSVNCNKIVFCSGFETTQLLKEKVADLFYTYACVSEQDIPLNKNLTDTLVWDTADPYLYMRTTDDGRLLIGGEDASGNFSFFQQRTKEKKAKKLVEKLQAILPGTHFIEDFSWGGTFGSTKDGLPYIGASPEYKNALFVLGFGGNGITFSIQAMDIIPDILSGKENKFTELYRFGR